MLGTRSRMRTAHNFESAIHRLPNEVISHIFLTGLPRPNEEPDEEQRRYHDNYKGKATRKYQVLVGSICRLWRSISLSTPTLWSAVVIVPPCSYSPDISKCTKRHEKMLDALLKRSQTLDLEVCLSLGGAGMSTLSEQMVLSALEAFERASTLIIETNKTLNIRELAGVMAQLFPFAPPPKLRCFRFHDYQHTFSSVSLNPVLKPDHPNLKLTQLRIGYSGYKFHLKSVEASALEDLSVNPSSVDGDVQAFFKTCSNLRKAKVLIGMYTFPLLLSSVSVTDLSICEDQTTNMMHPKPIPSLPQLLDFPNLRHLTLFIGTSTWQANDDVPWPHLPSLKSLSVGPAAEWDVQLAKLLLRCPELEAIEVAVENVKTLLDCLAPRPDTELSDVSDSQNRALAKLVLIRIMAPIALRRRPTDEERREMPAFKRITPELEGAKAFLEHIRHVKVEVWVEETFMTLLPLEEYGELPDGRLQFHKLSTDSQPPRLVELEGRYVPDKIAS